jgi:precorrin-4/cobalt-precorrin-4 C11-methyltransferase
MSSAGMVFFIGAGPGDPELITVKGQRLIARAALVLYTGSLVPAEVVGCASSRARVVDSAPLSLEETHALLVETVHQGQDAARVHTGDPSLYGAVREQIRLLERDGIAWEVVPGVTAAFAAAAAAGAAFTVPGGPQSLIVTRMAGRTPVRPEESIHRLATHGASMAVYLSADKHHELARELRRAGLPETTPVIVAAHVGCAQERIVRTRLADLSDTVEAHGFTRRTVFLVLPGEEGEGRSLLYDPSFSHGWREGTE